MSRRAASFLYRIAIVTAATIGAAPAAAQIVLYEHEAYGGRSHAGTGHDDNLSGAGFNDAASSAVVTGGRWQLCGDAEFRGRCVTLEPGRYPSLNAFGLNDQLSSLRRLAADDSVAAGAALLELYEHDDHAGRVHRSGAADADLSRAGYNDAASSAVVIGAHWQLCSDAGFRGRCVTLAPGRYASLTPFGLNDQLSSARPVAGDGTAAAAAPPIELYEHEGYGGRAWRSSDGSNDLNRDGFNDTASSVVVNEGRWQLCGDAGYGGRCVTLEPGRYGQLRDRRLNDQVSSLRRAGEPAVTARRRDVKGSN